MKYKIKLDFIEFYMWKYNLSKKEFCGLCNISMRTLNKLFKHDYNFGIHNLLNISNTIKIPMVLLFEEDNGN